MKKRILRSWESLNWDKFKNIFYLKYFLESIQCQMEVEFIQSVKAYMLVVEDEPSLLNSLVLLQISYLWRIKFSLSL